MTADIFAEHKADIIAEQEQAKARDSLRLHGRGIDRISEELRNWYPQT